MAQGLHAATQELLPLKQVGPVAAVVPLPDPARNAQCLLMNMTTNDDIKAFLGTFERIMTQEGWALRDWSCTLALLLTGEVQQA